MSDIGHKVPDPNVGDVDLPVEPNLEEYVKTALFDYECRKRALIFANSAYPAGGSFEDEDDFWPSDDGVSSDPAAGLSPHDVPNLEANLYFAGVTTSNDVFELPSDPEAYKRLMRVIAVLDTYEFGSGATWDGIRDQAVKLLDKRHKLGACSLEGKET